VEMLNRKFDKTDVIFVFGDEIMTIDNDRNYSLSYYPKGFCDIFDRLLNEILDIK
jgi:hypothetical protein